MTGPGAGRLTVLHVLEALSGGTSRHVVDLVQNLPHVRHVVAIPPARTGGVTDTRARAAMEAAGARVHVVDMRRLPFHPVNVRALLSLRRIVRDERPDVVHGHSSIGGALARCAPGRAARVYTPHGLTPGRAVQVVERLLGRRTSMLVLVSESERERAEELRLVPRARMTVIPNGIDLAGHPAPVDLHGLLGLPPDVALVGSVARLSPQKAPEDFVRMCLLVARQRPDVTFVVVGDGPSAELVRRLAAPLEDRFRLLPVLAGAAGAMSSLSVFVMMSRYEGAPYAPLEAAQAGVPLVLTDVVGNREVLRDGESGVLVRQGDAAAAADAVLRLLEDPAWRDGLTAAMTDRLHVAFDVRAQGRAHADLYAALAGQPREAGAHP